MMKSTMELTQELADREGVRKVLIAPYQEAKITTDQGEISLTGPAVILINQD